jgi:hypothetical protein
VVSTGAQTPGLLGFQSPGDYATFNSNHIPDGTHLFRKPVRKGARKLSHLMASELIFRRSVSSLGNAN